MNHDSLAAKISNQNLANATANDWQPRLIEIFKPLVGQKILKADGNLLAKIEKLIPPLPNTRKVRVYFDVAATRINLAWKVSANDPDSEFTVMYGEATIYVGTIDGDRLSHLYEPETYRADRTLEAVLAARKKADEARTIYEKARGECAPFGEGPY
jgi:hypothetical protein